MFRFLRAALRLDGEREGGVLRQSSGRRERHQRRKRKGEASAWRIQLVPRCRVMAQPRACQEQEDRLCEVNLSTQRLRVLPLTVLSNSMLESLDLDRNKLRRITGISKLCNLKRLILSKNEFVDFPSEIQSLVCLERLELNQNQIRIIPEGVFSHLPRLKHLRLNNNRLCALPRDLAACRGSLQYLNISNNLFRTFPQPVLQLACLQEFHVQNNALRQLPRELFQGQSLKMFKASGNPLREPPSEVCAGGIQQIRNYFNQLQHGVGQEDKRVKTMFLGASLAGKSTICRSLKQGQSKLVPKEERTVGIEISEFQIKDFTFLFWDFAGQLEYYMTHHVFITPQALVILVINLHMYQTNDKTFKELVGFWINNLSMRVPNSVVLPVGTHVDCCQEQEVAEKTHDIMARITAMLAERKSNLAHFIDNLEGSEEPKFYVDQWERLKEMESCMLTILNLVAVNCTDHRDIRKLKAIILKYVKNEELFPEVVRVLPPVYRQVEAAIVDIAQSEEMADHGMMDLQYLLSKLSQRKHLASLDRELLQDILRYLHRIGLVVWYEEINHLESTVFLQPTFLITMFKLLVRHHLVQQLESISVETLIGEHATIRDRANWVWTFKSKAMLCHKAVRALVKHQLCSEGRWDVFEEIMGHRPHRGRGKLFSLLEHFELCLEVKHTEALNPQAREFVPGKPWETTRSQGKSWYLFPTYLNQTEEVSEFWGGDHPEDLHIRAYFSPEIPEGFFQRLLVKACSFYSTHWVAKVTCLLVCNGKPLLIKENNQRAYSYLELRSRKPSERTGKIPDPYFMTPNPLSLSCHFQPYGKCPKKPLPHVLVWPGSTSSPLKGFPFLHGILFRTPLEVSHESGKPSFPSCHETNGSSFPRRSQQKVPSKRATQAGELFQHIIKFLTEVWLTGDGAGLTAEAVDWK
ncbi:malignant fibrous histiocytoma-amplified sequence 1 homolog isoform X1 [Anomalospiza imberbis]|uniref:malignant fibrous histiocytoma-amplified sequence 1 homolog isoform X1 n=1 Tax=Anomalospiza imberbis TaxID=187417 RepID=UPI00359014AA